VATSLDLCKEALAWTGTRSTLSSLSDGSAEANYCNLLYTPLRDFLLREGDYDFSLKRVIPTVAAVAAPPWSVSYNYPADALRIRGVIPSSYILLDPKPIAWNLLNVSNVRYIVSNESLSALLYTFAPIEDVFDSIFRESFVKLLSSALSFALTNRIEASDKSLKEALSFAGIANLRDS
jgi:hypothetical protein